MAAAAAAAVGGAASEGERSDEAEEDEVEEQLVMVELSGIIDSNFLEKCENKCKILGIETERPILQVDGYVFAGEYEDTLGTCVVFEENAEHVDVEGNQKVQLKYKCHTVKKLNMTRTLLTEKKEGEENVGGVEWLQIKDRDFSYSRPKMICNFMREKDDSEESGQAQDKLTEESEGEVSGEGNSDMNCDLEKQHTLEIDASIPLPDSPASGAEESPSGNAALEDVPS
ncbi:general transcription factor 3C polypeptide 6 isoform X3 [Myiozetetes cayanensis]|uniref:general transcription factor 3C polypeptide 6 isoform X3 n=1 Tax=Myiozetetes cayanensis TaxID=478635 RepID=UPI002160717F|nr:general transcription factor 3C polypeptide 6 isoform X3 [Myiozetetes cayanensis]